MQTIASGCIISAPVPIPRAITESPSTVVRAVIRIGLILVLPASTIASLRSVPSSLRLLI